MEAPTASWALPCVICPSGIRCLIRNVWQHLRISAPKNINHDVIDDCFTNFCSVNAKTKSTANFTLGSIYGANELIKNGNIVTFNVGYNLPEDSQLTEYNTVVVGTIPKGYRPIGDITVSMQTRNNGFFIFGVYPTGTVTVQRFASLGTARNVNINLTWITN